MASTALVGFFAVTLGVALARELTLPKADRAAGSDTQAGANADETPQTSLGEARGTR